MRTLMPVFDSSGESWLTCQLETEQNMDYDPRIDRRALQKCRWACERMKEGASSAAKRQMLEVCSTTCCTTHRTKSRHGNTPLRPPSMCPSMWQINRLFL